MRASKRKKNHFTSKFYEETKTNPTNTHKKTNTSATLLLKMVRCLTKKLQNFLTFVACLIQPTDRWHQLQSQLLAENVKKHCCILTGKKTAIVIAAVERYTRREKVAKVKLCHDNDSDDKIGQIHFVNAHTQFMNICTYSFLTRRPIFEFLLFLLFCSVKRSCSSAVKIFKNHTTTAE